MSIGSVGAAGAGHISQLLSKMLSRLDQNSADDTSATAAQPATASASKDENCKTPMVGGQGTLSDKILGLMIMLQAQGSSSAGGPSRGDPVAQTFQAMDGDGDGSVSEAEMETYVQTLGGTKAEADKLFAGLGGEEANGISKDALAAAADAGRPDRQGHGHKAHGPHGGSGATKIFDALDTNKDGTVSADELAAAFASDDTNATSGQSLFGQMDANSDGSVTKDEFSTFLNGLFDKARSDAGLLSSFRELASRSYGATDSLLTPPTAATQSVDA